VQRNTPEEYDLQQKITPYVLNPHSTFKIDKIPNTLNKSKILIFKRYLSDRKKQCIIIIINCY